MPEIWKLLNMRKLKPTLLWEKLTKYNKDMTNRPTCIAQARTTQTILFRMQTTTKEKPCSVKNERKQFLDSILLNISISLVWLRLQVNTKAVCMTIFETQA